jgi:hypothetical protein
MASYVLEVHEPFLDACAHFATLLDWLAADTTAGQSHSGLEDEITQQIRQVAGLAYQGHLDLRAKREQRLTEVVDADGVTRHRAEYGRERSLTTVFGEVIVERIAYREHGHPDLHPADGQLNLPVEHHSHGLRRLAAIEATRGSYDQAREAIERVTGQTVGKRQVEALTVRAAADVDGFYAAHQPDPVDARLALGMSADAKGIVMRTEALRAATAKAAPSRRLATRLTAGEKRGRKRMAEVVAVFDVETAVRSVDDILPAPGHRPCPGPLTSGKWLAASVEREATDMIMWMVGEAHRRDPAHERDWFAVVDGNAHQIERITAEAKRHHKPITIIVDIVHVLEYAWGAAWCLYPRADPAAETWVRALAHQILAGDLDQAITDLTDHAAGLPDDRRTGIDKAIGYLRNHRAWLDYPTALTKGWPIASGVIEGACRHLVKDRLDLTGARWGLASAEAVLKLRAVISNGDFPNYWAWHLKQERNRVHATRYRDHTIPTPDTSHHHRT